MIAVNVARANHDIARTALSKHQETCTASCTVSGAPFCVKGQSLLDAYHASGDELAYSERMERINAGR